MSGNVNDQLIFPWLDFTQTLIDHSQTISFISGIYFSVNILIFDIYFYWLIYNIAYIPTTILYIVDQTHSNQEHFVDFCCFDLYCFNVRVFVLDQRMAFSGHVTFDIVLPTIFASQSALNFPLIDLLVWLSLSADCWKELYSLSQIFL